MYFRLIIISCFLTLGFSIDSQARRYSSKIKIKPILKTELNKLLAATNDLHGACFRQNELRIEAQLKIVILKIKLAHQKTSLAKEPATHLNKMLEAARVQLELAQMNEGEKRQESIKQAFKQLVQIAKVYKLDNYRIFFCSKDKSVWLQKDWRAKNPINPENLKHCGKLVR
jgi:hypothetical protein